jgi:hypothetical protein
MLECGPTKENSPPTCGRGQDESQLSEKSPVISWWKLKAGEQRVLNDLWTTRLSCGYIMRHLAHPLSPPFRQQLVYLFQSSCVSLTEGGGGIGAKSYDGEKTWSSINHSILSAWEGYWVGVQL